MGEIHKTKEVADQFGVSPSTIYRWVRFYRIPCRTNRLGHFEFEEHEVEILAYIHRELSKGKPMEDITLDHIDLPAVSASAQTTGAKVVGYIEGAHTTPNEKLTKTVRRLEEHIERLESALHHKADEVVSTQILMHRNSIDQLHNKIATLEDKVSQLEEQVQAQTSTATTQPDGIKKNTSFGSFIKQVFSS